jgi:hypothetical protein
MVAVAALMAVRWRWWWAAGTVAAVASQALILTAWRDAWAGTIANLVLVAAAVHGYASLGPRSLRATFWRRAAGVEPAPVPPGPVTEADVARLPGEQVNRFGADPVRLFFMDATMAGLPVDVLHVLAGGHATMQARACSLKTMVDAAGPEVDQAEAVTVLNDLCLLAPAALVDAPVEWLPADDHHVKALFTWGGHTVAAELIFNDQGDLVDFVSDDRLQASAGGSTFTPMRWSTPIRAWGTFGPWRAATAGEGRWHDHDGAFTYLEFHADEITFTAGVSVDGAGLAGPAPSA